MEYISDRIEEINTLIDCYETRKVDAIIELKSQTEITTCTVAIQDLMGEFDTLNSIFNVLSINNKQVNK